MIETILLLVVLVIQIFLLVKKPESAEKIAPLVERTERALRDEVARSREDAHTSAREGREELGRSILSFNESILARMTDIAGLQKNQLRTFSDQLSKLSLANEERFNHLRETVESRLQRLQDDNNRKLEEMRATVDEKLHATLEKRLGDSFKIVSVRLELVHKGLGEMQTLAAGVGDLKKVLSNIKMSPRAGLQLCNIRFPARARAPKMPTRPPSKGALLPRRFIGVETQRLMEAPSRRLAW